MSADYTSLDSRFAIEALLVAAKGWTHQDDWGVPVTTYGVLEDLAEAIMAGDSPMALRRHAKHAGLDDCVRARCDVTCFTYITRSRLVPSEQAWVDRLRQSIEERGLTFGEGRL